MHFRLSDVFLPSREDLGIAHALQDADELEGTVVGFSDSGFERHAFAVVKVVRTQNVVVPTAKLRMVSASAAEAEGNSS